MLGTLVCLVVCTYQDRAHHHQRSMPEPEYSRLPKNVAWNDDDHSIGFGSAIAVGDVDGDGIGDVIAGVPQMTAGHALGAIVVFDGLTLDAMAVVTSLDVGIGGLGAWLTAFDVTGDGQAEIITQAGYRTAVLGGRQLRLLKSFPDYPVALDHGDCNGDGLQDLIIAVGDSSTEAAAVYLGPDLSTRISVPLLPGVALRDQLAVGDLNADGTDDVLLSSSTGKGRCWFSLGPAFATTQEIKDPTPGGSYGGFGRRLAVADFNDDGHCDALVTSVQTDCEFYDLCRDCLVFFGPDFSHWQQVTDRRDGWRYGLGAAATKGDVNGDGVADVISVALMPFDAGGYDRYLPEYFAYLGPDLVEQARFHPLDRDQHDHYSLPGWAMSAVDLDRDGHDEFVVGNPAVRSRWDTQTWFGSIYVFDFSAGHPISAYAHGSPGSGGFEPVLGASGSARLGSVLEVSIANGLGGATGTLVHGQERTSRILCEKSSFTTLSSYVWLVPQAAIPFVLDGALGVPGAGSAKLRVVLPPDPALVHELWFFQALVDDAVAPCGVACTSGLQVSLQP